MNIKHTDKTIITRLRILALPIARAAVFIVYFYFGVLKLAGESPASPLALALTAKTIGTAHFDLAFNVLAIFECLIGILFLIPKAVRIVVPMLLVHLLIVCSPLVLVPELAWVKPFVPTLEGQYIIKNVLLVAIALGVAAQTKPLQKKS
jgi:uncharacterized membrane protein YkgB